MKLIRSIRSRKQDWDCAWKHWNQNRFQSSDRYRCTREMLCRKWDRFQRYLITRIFWVFKMSKSLKYMKLRNDSLNISWLCLISSWERRSSFQISLLIRLIWNCYLNQAMDLLRTLSWKIKRRKRRRRRDRDLICYFYFSRKK